VFLFSWWERAVWCEIEITSSVDLLGRYANWSGSIKGEWDDGVDLNHDQSFKALHGKQFECHSAIVM
jgi:hypothetical protein